MVCGRIASASGGPAACWVRREAPSKSSLARRSTKIHFTDLSTMRSRPIRFEKVRSLRTFAVAIPERVELKEEINDGPAQRLVLLLQRFGQHR